jgi:hypothetical protein
LQFLSPSRPAGSSSGSTRRPPCSGRHVASPPTRASCLTYARATCATSRSTSRRRLIYCPFRALLHLPTWADRRRTFERVASSLLPGGRFAGNAFAFDHHVAAGLDGSHQSDPVPHTIHYAVGDNRVDITLDEGGTSSLWRATKNELLGLLDVEGFQLEALYGGFCGEPFNDDSREYVFVARR